MRPRVEGETIDFELGPIRVFVSPKPIEAIPHVLDAIVSSDDTHLSMSGGVSAAILKAAGPELKREALQLLPVNLGDVCVTKAGALPVKYVLHAISVDWDKGVLPTERTVRRLSREIFRRCEALGINALGVSALATGAARFSPDRSARIMIQSLAEHVQNPTILKTVVFSLPEKVVHEAFLSQLESFFGRPFFVGTDVLASPRVAESFARSSESSGVASHEVGVDRLAETTMFHQDPAALRRARRASGSPSALESKPVLGGRYVLLEELGRGGMGIVHLAWDLRMKRTFAVKTIRGDRQSQAAILLEREAAIWIGLNHEGIVRLHHFEPNDPLFGPYVVMEYVDWVSGDKWISDAGSRGLPVRAVINVGIKLCRALRYAHERRVLHGDIKPANFFIDQAAEEAKLSDFGLARVGGQGSGKAFLVELAGTPMYMAPEQRKLGAKIGPTTDVYLLAASLWECLTGEPPQEMSAAAPVTDDERLPALRTLQKALVGDPSARPDAVKLEELLMSTSA